MKRASNLLFSIFPRQKSNSTSPQICRYCLFENSPSSVTRLARSSHRHLEACAISNGLLLKPHGFQANPSRNMDTLIQTAPQISSRQRKAEEKLELERAFESAETREEMLRAFKEMEEVLDERELGLPSLKLGLKLDQEGENPEMALTFASRAFRVLDREDGKPSLQVAMTLQLMGSATYNLKRFSESLGYLNRANRVLGLLQKDKNSSIDDVRLVLHAVLSQLANVQTEMGRREEALENLRKCLDIKEMILDKDSKELAGAYRGVAEAYVVVLNFKAALPFALKALEIHKLGLGNNSVEVAHDRKLLGVVYTGLEEHQKALEQNEQSQKILKNWGLNSDLLHAEIDSANMQMALGKYDEAINSLKSVVNRTEKNSDARALIFISMGKTLVNQEKFADSKRYLEMACAILDKKEKISPLDVADAYSEIAMQYETMNELETSIFLLKRTLSLYEKLPQEQHSEGSVSARIGWLHLLTGKVSEAIPYLENAAERLKASFGSKHYGVGYVYNNLGAAYLELERPQSAAQMFAVAKEIMDVSLGPHHADSIDACQNLSKAYAAIGSYAIAVEFQQQAIDAWESHGPIAKSALTEAQRILEELKTKAHVESMNLIKHA